MKKYLSLAAFALLAALAVDVAARPTNAWNFKSLLLQSDQTLTVQGPANFTGAVTLSGATMVQATAGTSTLLTPGTAATASTVLGFDNTPSIALGTSGQNTGVNISTVIPVNGSYETVISSGGPIVLTSLPTIATTTVVGGSTLIPDGTFLVITSTSTNGITLQSNGNLAGTQLFLGATTRVIALHKRLFLQFYQNVPNAAYWEEVAYIDDNH